MSAYFVYITAKDAKEASKIGKALVKGKLAACVNILPGVSSIYRWEGKIEEAKEVVIIAKTRKKLLKDIEKVVKELHSYECPCIVFLPTKGGNKDFLKWIKQETK